MKWVAPILPWNLYILQNCEDWYVLGISRSSPLHRILSFASSSYLGISLSCCILYYKLYCALSNVSLNFDPVSQWTWSGDNLSHRRMVSCLGLPNLPVLYRCLHGWCLVGGTAQNISFGPIPISQRHDILQQAWS